MKKDKKESKNSSHNIEDLDKNQFSPDIKHNTSSNNKHNLLLINSNDSEDSSINTIKTNSSLPKHPKNKNKKKNKDKKKDMNMISNNSIKGFKNSINSINYDNKSPKYRNTGSINNNKQKEPSNQQKLEEANNQMSQMNYAKAEEKYKSIYENCTNYSNQFIINLLNNYSLCLYHQRKFEEATKIASTIILEYDNKNKRAYLTLLNILYNIKEYKKATELVEKLLKIFKKPKDFELFRGVIYDINNAINEEEDNIQRENYYNKEKKILNFLHNDWAFYGLCTLGSILGGFILYRMIKK